MSMHDDACPTPLLLLPLQKKGKEHLCWQVHCLNSEVEKEKRNHARHPVATSISAALTSFLHLH